MRSYYWCMQNYRMQPQRRYYCCPSEWKRGNSNYANTRTDARTTALDTRPAQRVGNSYAGKFSKNTKPCSVWGGVLKKIIAKITPIASASVAAVEKRLRSVFGNGRLPNAIYIHFCQFHVFYLINRS